MQWVMLQLLQMVQSHLIHRAQLLATILPITILVNMTAGGTITIANGFTITNANTFTQGAGKMIFAGAGTAVGAFTYNNIEVNGAVNIGNGNTVNGILTLKLGGSLVSNVPTYGASSTLTYTGTASTFNPGIEWTSNAASGIGVPQNVTVSSNTTLDFATSSNYYQLLGNFNINRYI